MADERLRDLARWSQGDLQTQARLLRDRMRVGELDEDRVRLAAHLRDPASHDVLGTSAPELEPAEWVRGLAAWGQEALVRACLALGEASYATWWPRDAGFLPPAEVEPDGEWVWLALRALERWVLAPGDDHTEPLQTAALQVWNALLQAEHKSSSDRLAAARTTQWAVRCAGGEPQLSSVALDPAHDAVNAVRQAEGILGAEAVVQAIQADLVPWALRLGDPVASRVKART